jgi:hypothetical protein
VDFLEHYRNFARIGKTCNAVPLVDDLGLYGDQRIWTASNSEFLGLTGSSVL